MQAVHGHSSQNMLAAFPALVIAGCAALAFVAVTIICMFFTLRPLLKVGLSQANLLWNTGPVQEETLLTH